MKIQLDRLRSCLPPTSLRLYGSKATAAVSAEPAGWNRCCQVVGFAGEALVEAELAVNISGVDTPEVDRTFDEGDEITLSLGHEPVSKNVDTGRLMAGTWPPVCADSLRAQSVIFDSASPAPGREMVEVTNRALRFEAA